MSKINININNSKLVGFRVELEDKYPKVVATIGLFSGDKQISTFNAGTKGSWQNHDIEISVKCVDLICAIAEELEYSTTIACSSAIGLLESPKTKKSKKIDDSIKNGF